MDDSGMGHQQEGQLDPLKVTMSRITERAQLVEEFILEPSKAKLREISSKSKAQNMARPLMRLGNPITSIKAHKMRGVCCQRAEENPQAAVSAGYEPRSAGDQQHGDIEEPRGAQENEAGWPFFIGKYVAYPRFRKEWWAYRRTYHVHVMSKLVCCTLNEKCLAADVKTWEGMWKSWMRSWVRWTTVRPALRSI
jgi:hypothetical protein